MHYSNTCEATGRYVRVETCSAGPFRCSLCSRLLSRQGQGQGEGKRAAGSLPKRLAAAGRQGEKQASDPGKRTKLRGFTVSQHCHNVLQVVCHAVRPGGALSFQVPPATGIRGGKQLSKSACHIRSTQWQRSVLHSDSSLQAI